MSRQNIKVFTLFKSSPKKNHLNFMFSKRMLCMAYLKFRRFSNYNNLIDFIIKEMRSSMRLKCPKH